MKRRSTLELRRQAGFTLIEMIVSLIVLVQIIGVALLLFQFNGRVTRTQTRLSEMQQSLRVGQNEMVRMVRMVGRGGLQRFWFGNTAERVLPELHCSLLTLRPSDPVVVAP